MQKKIKKKKKDRNAKAPEFKLLPSSKVFLRFAAQSQADTWDKKPQQM